MRYNHKFTERRATQGKFKPRVYLFFEFLILVGMVGLVALYARMPIVVFGVAGAALFYFIMSALPRYQKVLERQKDTHHD